VRTVIYTRVSLDRSGEGLGVSRQLDDCRGLVAHRGWTVTREFVENDVSAAGKRPRPHFEDLLRDIEAGAVDAVVAWSLDRLTRNRRDTVRLIETCEPRRVVIALVRGSDLDLATPAGRMTAGILAEVARHEIDQKGDRQRRAAQQAAERGLPPGGPRPFGFDDDRLTLREDEAQAIRDGYAAVLAGASIASVARDWNDRGLGIGRPRTSKLHVGEPSQWSAPTVRTLLLKPRNAGLRARHGEVVGDAQWPAIVPESTWRATVAALTSSGRLRRHQAPPNTQYLLSGVALCGVCGSTVNAGTHRGRYHAYRCREALGHVARRGDDADTYVSEVVIARLAQPDAAVLLEDGKRPDVGQLRDTASALRARLEALAVEFADGELTAGQLRAASERLRERLAATEAELADAGRVSILGPLVGTADVRAAWGRLSTDRQRAVIDLLMTVTLHPTGRGARKFNPDTVAIEWKVDS
jgi:DNA invertase Pin-like site-specific DNA recombinase